MDPQQQAYQWRIQSGQPTAQRPAVAAPLRMATVQHSTMATPNRTVFHQPAPLRMATVQHSTMATPNRAVFHQPAPTPMVLSQPTPQVAAAPRQWTPVHHIIPEAVGHVNTGLEFAAAVGAPIPEQAGALGAGLNCISAVQALAEAAQNPTAGNAGRAAGGCAQAALGVADQALLLAPEGVSAVQVLGSTIPILGAAVSGVMYLGQSVSVYRNYKEAKAYLAANQEPRNDPMSMFNHAAARWDAEIAPWYHIANGVLIAGGIVSGFLAPAGGAGLAIGGAIAAAGVGVQIAQNAHSKGLTRDTFLRLNPHDQAEICNLVKSDGFRARVAQKLVRIGVCSPTNRFLYCKHTKAQRRIEQHYNPEQYQEVISAAPKVSTFDKIATVAKGVAQYVPIVNNFVSPY